VPSLALSVDFVEAGGMAARSLGGFSLKGAALIRSRR
jgi:hypothetical protein